MYMYLLIQQMCWTSVHTCTCTCISSFNSGLDKCTYMYMYMYLLIQQMC